MNQPTKVCNTCKAEKPLSEFYRYSTKSLESHHYAACKVCHNERVAKKSNAPKFQRDPNAERRTKPQAPHQPLNVQRDIGPGVSAARPGAFDHEKHGSRLPDGSVRPYRQPTFGCVGKLASSSQKLDANIIKQHKEKRK